MTDKQKTYHKRGVKKWRKNNLSAVRLMKTNYARRTRKKILERLGGQCSNCPANDFRCLQIDHKNGGGKHELVLYPGGTRYYYMLLRLPLEELRAKYQVLCANCNWIKRWENNEI